MSKSTTNNNDTLPEIPGVEQLDTVLPGSKLVVGDFYEDERELLKRRAVSVMDRSTIFITPRVGWPKAIYRKPELSK